MENNLGVQGGGKEPSRKMADYEAYAKRYNGGKVYKSVNGDYKSIIIFQNPKSSDNYFEVEDFNGDGIIDSRTDRVFIRGDKHFSMAKIAERLTKNKNLHSTEIGAHNDEKVQEYKDSNGNVVGMIWYKGGVISEVMIKSSSQKLQFNDVDGDGFADIREYHIDYNN